ncbi:MAG: ImmA/IrrE family metallo-endopeptidase, partial [Candidatus Eremiobacteraeota bacterium]|nr:ImmA/IrrE family metallo-endopeptidase [Candidatus Eremiobacteraeota bacterium]
MAFDLELLSSKLKRYRTQFQFDIDDLSNSTGIPVDRITEIENGIKEPTGDEILILADFYMVDYKFFISNQQIAPFEQTETLFRNYDEELFKEDRWAIQEFLFLCECEEFLMRKTSFQRLQTPFHFKKRGTYFKEQGKEAAEKLRKYLRYDFNKGIINIYNDFRKIGFHVFRRRLDNPRISGLFIRHPTAGNCILVNYNEDIYRQRFSAAHEAAHAILDDNGDSNISFKKYDRNKLSEIRANAFASNFLIPGELLINIPDSSKWTIDKGREWARNLKVSTSALAYALKDANLITQETVMMLKSNPLNRKEKIDPELQPVLSPKILKRKKEALKLGLSSFYVNLCFDAYEKEVISIGRLAEMLSISDSLISEGCIYILSKNHAALRSVIP